MGIQDRNNTSLHNTTHVVLNLWWVSLVLVGLGIVFSGYLSYVKLADKETLCLEGEGFRCDVVLSSKYADIVGIPIAYLGLMTYLAIGALLLFERRWVFFKANGIFPLFGLVLFAFLYSIYLVYLQGAVLDAWCQWCLAHEITMTMLFIITALRLKQFLITAPE